MLICNRCGRAIGESDLGTHREYISDYGDDKYYETYADECACGGEFVEAVKCGACEEWCTEEDLSYGWRYNIRVCKGCIDFYKNKYQRLYNQLTLNGTDDFIDWLVDHGEISS